MHAWSARQRLTAPCTCPAQVQLRVRVPKPGGKDLKSCAVPVHLPAAGSCRDAAGYEGQTHCQELALVLKADGRTVEAKVRSALGPCIWTERLVVLNKGRAGVASGAGTVDVHPGVHICFAHKASTASCKLLDRPA